VWLRLLLQLSEPATAGRISFGLNGSQVSIPDDGASLLDALREHLGCRSVKDGCSPQGQCGCCTVWVDGLPRVSCVTAGRRVAGREVTTVEGLSDQLRRQWTEAFVETGASQCGFCTPGILMRLASLEHRRATVDDTAVRTALSAHLCRCTGWQSIVEAARLVRDDTAHAPVPRDPLLAAWRAQVEGPTFQSAGVEVVLGRGGFADDAPPPGALVALADDPDLVVPAPDIVQARRRSGAIPGRNSTVALQHPVALPDGDWALTLRTTWVEPAYLEPDASWCTPGGHPASPLANGGAFGGKRRSPVPELARRLAEEHGRAVRVLWSRETVVRRGAKRPPVALGVAADGTGVMRLARPPGSADLGPLRRAVAAVLPNLVVEEVVVPGPPVAPEVRGAGWAEAAAVRAVLPLALAGTHGTGHRVEVALPGSGRAAVTIDSTDEVFVEVWAGAVLDAVTLRSYCLGAVHQALSWVRREGIAVDESGVVQDLTIRSFGILSARDTPTVQVTIHPQDTLPVNGSDAVFAAVAAAAWLADGLAGEWPTRR
jgi:xanthine dehydrogenase small subunit